MRIGLLTDMYRPCISGVVNFVIAYKRALEKLGEEVYVFTFGDYDDDEERVIRSPSIPVKKDLGVYLGLDLGSRAKKICKTMDVLHAHHPFISGPLGVLYGRKWGIPLVFTSHTRYERYAHYVPLVPESLTRAVLDAYLPRFLDQCDLVIAPSRSTYQTLVAYDIDTPVEVVPNGIELDLFDHPRVRYTREDLRIPSSASVLIYAGRMAKEKDIDFLLEAYAQALTEFSDLFLLLLGSGPELEALKGMAAQLGIDSKLRFVGEVPYEHVPAYLMMADLFVMPSGGEVHPLSIIEAFAAGLPVLGLRVPGVEDVIVDGITGRLTYRIMSSYAHAMGSLVQDRETLTRMSQEARREGHRNSILRTASRMLELYQRLVDSGRGKGG